MLRFLSTILAVVIGLFLFTGFFIVVLIGSVAGSSEEKPMPRTMVLELDAREEIVDLPTLMGMPSTFGGGLTVVGIVQALEHAEKDPAVKGVLIRTNSSMGVDPALAEEVRSAVADFKATGKFVISFVQDLSDPALSGYYLASVAEQVWLQPSGFVFPQGVATSTLYFKGTLDKLDLSAEVLHYHEYKSAMFPFIHDGPTDAETEAESRLITSVFDSFSDSIATSRSMTKEAFVALLNGGPYTGEEALKTGWVDKLGFAADAEEAALARAGEDAEVVELAEYAAKKGPFYNKGTVIAFIQGEGSIVEGESEQSLFGSSGEIGGDTTSQAILDAAEDEDVKAIIFRVNSPGGSPTASDQVWNAIERAQKAGKPVVINMSGLAASGGYWVSMGADKIIAEPSTITGSIGIYGAKFVLKGLYEKLGVTSTELSVGGDKAFMFSEQHAFTPAERVALQKLLGTYYDEFVQKVADGRGIPIETAKELAKGRVWSGADAKARGLVDELGGLKTSIKVAKELAKIDPAASVELRSFPRQKSFVEELFTAFGASTDVARSLTLFAEVMRLQPTTEVIEGLKARDDARSSRIRARAEVPALR